jgi:outer membrane protein, heavy metal efflux system
MIFLRYFVFAGLVGCSLATFAQDTLRLTLPETERIFFEKNYQILAQRFNIQAADAAVRQARLYSNPNIAVLTNAYNPQTGKLFPLQSPTAEEINSGQYPSGQMDIQISQLITTAGKRSKLVRLSQSNRQLQNLAFDDLIRTLRFQLYSQYAELYFDLQAYRLLQTEAAQQRLLVRAMQISFRQGGVSAYEVTRLEAELQSIQADMNHYLSQIADDQAAVKVFLGVRDLTAIEPAEPPLALRELPALNAAADSAQANRPDLKVAFEQVEYAQRNIDLQKAQRVPDLRAGLEFDRFGNAYRNLLGINLAMDIPVFNRNQGNIKIAQIQAEGSKKAIEYQQVIVQNQVMDTYTQLRNLTLLNTTVTEEYKNGLKNISTEAVKNYNSRTIGLLDYLDKIRTYKSAQLNLINLRNNLFQSQQELNYVTNSRFF